MNKNSRNLDLRSFARELFKNIQSDNTFDIAAELAFWSILAIFPFMIFLLTLIGYLPIAGMDEQLMGFIQEALPTATSQLVENTIHQIVGQQHGWLLVVSVLGALWCASSGVSAP